MLAQHQALSRVFVPPCTGGMFAPPAAALGPDTSRRLAGTLAACCVLQVMQNGCQAMARGKGWFFRHPAVGDAWMAQITAGFGVICPIFGRSGFSSKRIERDPGTPVAPVLLPAPQRSRVAGS